MPTYTFFNKESGIEYDVEMKISELDEYKANNPNCEQQLKAPNIVAGVGGTLSRTSDGWKDHLKKIKATSGKGNTINV